MPDSWRQKCFSLWGKAKDSKGFMQGPGEKGLWASSAFTLWSGHLGSRPRDLQLAGTLFLKSHFQARNPFSTSSECHGTAHPALAVQPSSILCKLIYFATLQHLSQSWNLVQAAGPTGGAEGPPSLLLRDPDSFTGGLSPWLPRCLPPRHAGHGDLTPI